MTTALRILCFLLLTLSINGTTEASQRKGMASFYTRASVLAEGNSGVMANGEIFDEEALTAASWGYPFGTNLVVVCPRTARTVQVKVTDRGPGIRLVRKGRILDLSKKAFSVLAPLSDGVIPIVVEVLE